MMYSLPWFRPRASDGLTLAKGVPHRLKPFKKGEGYFRCVQLKSTGECIFLPQYSPNVTSGLPTADNKFVTM